METKFKVGDKVYMIVVKDAYDWYIKRYGVDEPLTVKRIKTTGILPNVNFLYDVGLTEVKEATYGDGWGYVTRWIKEDILVHDIPEGIRRIKSITVENINKRIASLRGQIDNINNQIKIYEKLKIEVNNEEQI